MTPPKVATAMMLYMSAQNELSRQATENIADIAANVRLDNLAFYIMNDTFAEARRGGAAKRTTEVLRLPPGAAKRDFKARQLLPDATVTDAAVFDGFLGEAETEFQSFATRQKILVLWGHGGGMVMLDEGEGSGAARASVVKFADTLEARAGSRTDPLRFDIIAFDSCYMGMIEGIHQFREIAGYALVSSTVVDASGYPYRAIVRRLKKEGPKLDPRRTARLISDEYNAHYRNLGPMRRRFLYACDMTRTAACISNLNTLGETIAGCFAPVRRGDPVRKALAQALLAAHNTMSYAGVLIFLDKLLGEMEGVIDAASFQRLSERAAALRGSVRDAFYGPLGDDGMVPTSPLIWCPVNPQEFRANVKRYAELDASAAGTAGWISMWRQYHGHQAAARQPMPRRSRFAMGVREGYSW